MLWYLRGLNYKFGLQLDKAAKSYHALSFHKLIQDRATLSNILWPRFPSSYQVLIKYNQQQNKVIKVLLRSTKLIKTQTHATTTHCIPKAFLSPDISFSSFKSLPIHNHAILLSYNSKLKKNIGISFTTNKPVMNRGNPTNCN